MIVITLDDIGDAERIRDLLAEEMPRDSIQLSAGSRGFDGVSVNDVMVLAAVISPVMIKRVADVLISLISTKGQREIKVNGVSLKGYSLEDATALLAAAKPAKGRPEP